jgi:hypothetical protein
MAQDAGESGGNGERAIGRLGDGEMGSWGEGAKRGIQNCGFHKATSIQQPATCNLLQITTISGE